MHLNPTATAVLYTNSYYGCENCSPTFLYNQTGLSAAKSRFLSRSSSKYNSLCLSSIPPGSLMTSELRVSRDTLHVGSSILCSLTVAWDWKTLGNRSGPIRLRNIITQRITIAFIGYYLSLFNVPHIYHPAGIRRG